MCQVPTGYTLQNNLDLYATSWETGSAWLNPGLKVYNLQMTSLYLGSDLTPSKACSLLPLLLSNKGTHLTRQKSLGTQLPSLPPLSHQIGPKGR